MFQTFGGFTSGIGICYKDSLITNTQHQSHAKNLVIGQRVLPQVFLRAADCRPFEIQDLLPADARFKIILFIGDTSDSRQLGIIDDLANELDGVLGKLAPSGQIFTMFDILAVCSDTKTSIRLGYKKLPLFLRSHWSRYVYLLATCHPSFLIHINILGFLLTTRMPKVVEATDTRITGSTTRLAP